MSAIDDAAEAVLRGGVIVYPTDTLWGLGAMIDDEAAVRRVFELKKRPFTEPLTIAVGSTDEIADYAFVTPAARRLFPLLPGPLTMVLEKRDTVPDLVTSGGKTVGIRVPGHPECLELLGEIGAITATSANLHGGPEPVILDDVRAIFGNRVDFYLDVGSKPLGRASTLVDATVEPVRILRLGAIRDARIRELFID